MTTTTKGINWLFKQLYDWNQVPEKSGYAGYMKTLLLCANGDGELAPEEKDWVIGYAAAFGASEATIQELENYKAQEDIATVVGETLDATATGRSAIYDAFRACAADGHVSEEEKATIYKMAASLGISKSITEELEEIYASEAKLRARRIALFFPNGNIM